MSQPSIAIAADISEYFQEVVSDAIRVRHVDATSAATTYLVGLLVDYAHPDEEAGSSFDRPLTFVLHDAMSATGAERFRKLRSLGDHVLYALGFFGGHVEQKGLDRRYMVNVGTTAYQGAASMFRGKAKASRPRSDATNATEPEAIPSVLSELAIKFERFTDVLRDVSEGTIACGARDQRSVVMLYERWLRTGSTRIAEELGARGLLPSRGPVGLS